MQINRYKDIVFAKGYHKPFADFVKECGEFATFKRLSAKDRQKGLKEAYKAAIKGNKPVNLKDGDSTRAIKKGKIIKSTEDK